MDRQQIASLLAKTGRGLIIQGYDTVTPIHPQIAQVQPIDAQSGYEGRVDDVLDDVGEFLPRAQGGRIQRDEIKKIGVAGVAFHTFTRSHSFPIDQMRAIENSPNPEAAAENLMGRIPESWGEEAARQRDGWITGALEAGVLAAGSVQYFDNSHAGFADPNAGFIYDGKPLFATDHPIRSGGPLSNLITSSPLNAANLEAARIRFSFTNAVNHRGRRVQISPNILMVPPSLAKTADILVGSEREPGTAQNDLNVQNGRFRVVVNPYLTSSDGWFLMTDRFQLPLEMWSNGAPEIEVDYDIETRSFVMAIEVKTGFRARDWRVGLACNYASS